MIGETLREAGARPAAAPRRRSRPSAMVRTLRRDAVLHLGLLALLALTFYPFIAMLIVSGKTFGQVVASPIGLTLPFHLENYATAWSFISPYILNSIIVSGASCLGVLVFSTLSAYAFARFRFPGREFLFFAIISLLMVPGILTLVPSFVLVKNLGLIDTRWALILPYTAAGQVFGIFLLRSFFAGLPEELFESARIDGAGNATILLRLVIPLSLSILATLAILNLLSTWNDIIWPSVVIYQPALKTLAIGLLQFQSGFQSDLGSQMAGYAIASLPLIALFAFTSRYFIAGLTSGALKV